MPRPKKPWFRVYADIIFDDKIRPMEPEHRWLWIAVLCLARKSPQAGVLLRATGKPMTIGDIADAARLDVKVAREGLTEFCSGELEMLHILDGAYAVTHWHLRQFDSDDVSTRVAKSRDRTYSDEETEQKDHLNGHRSNVTTEHKCDYSNVAKEQEQDCSDVTTEQNHTDSIVPTRDARLRDSPELQSYRVTEKTEDQSAEGDATGTQPSQAADADTQKPKRFIKPTVEQAEGYFAEKGFPGEGERFVDFFASKGWKVGKNAMIDWQAAARNWMRNCDKPKPATEPVLIPTPPDEARAIVRPYVSQFPQATTSERMTILEYRQRQEANAAKGANA